VGDVARALGKGSTLAYKGKTYTLAPWNYNVQSGFEMYVEDIVMSGAVRRAAKMPVAMGDRLIATTSADIDLGEYSFGSDACQRMGRLTKHYKHLVLLMLLENHNDATKELVDEMWEAGMEAAILRAVDAANADPTTTPAKADQAGAA
jgi:hypothetical protein